MFILFVRKYRYFFFFANNYYVGSKLIFLMYCKKQKLFECTLNKAKLFKIFENG